MMIGKYKGGYSFESKSNKSKSSVILRSVTKHIREQNWFAVFLDFFIVVVGVFIGIQVSNWDQERKNNALAADYVERIKVDIAEQVSLLNHISNYYQLVYNHGQAAIQAMNQPTESLDTEFLIDLFQSSQRLNFLVNQSTYDELLSTGRIANISNKRTRNLITNYYRRISSSNITVNEISPYRRLIRLYMDASIQSQILQNCGDVYRKENESSYYVTLPESCEISIDEAESKSAIAELKANQEIVQELSFHITVVRSILGSVENAVDIASLTLAKLNEQQP